MEQVCSTDFRTCWGLLIKKQGIWQVPLSSPFSIGTDTCQRQVCRDRLLPKLLTVPHPGVLLGCCVLRTCYPKPELRANLVEVTWAVHSCHGYTAAITCMASYHDAPGLTPQPPTPATLWAAPSCHSVRGDPAYD